MTRKILLTFGTRPEAIKMAPLYHALKARADEFETRVCVTAQHREMLDQALQLFEIVPDIDLDLMRPGQDLYDINAAVLVGMRDVLARERPDAVLVHGDTTTTLAASMAAFYSGVRVGHVEAGLRTHDLRAPFPEEFNRQVTSRIAEWHFAPTQESRANLLAERITDASITVTGNTVIDALHWVLRRMESDSGRLASVEAAVWAALPIDCDATRYVLVTFHRRENFGDGFMQICQALLTLAERFPDLHFVCPVHLNPNVRKPVNALLRDHPRIHLAEPFGYEPFLYLLRRCHLALTDSGGIQEEAPSLGKPVLVMRERTERPEAVAAGTVRLVGASRERIEANVAELVSDEASYRSMSMAHNPYGDGQACERILSVLRTI